jgi:hypothetical protein
MANRQKVILGAAAHVSFAIQNKAVFTLPFTFRPFAYLLKHTCALNIGAQPECFAQ